MGSTHSVSNYSAQYKSGEGGGYSEAAASLRAEDATPGGSKARLFGGGTVDPTRGRGGWRQILEGLS